MISDQHRTIFIHIPKTAGQSIETLFLNNLGLSWEERHHLLLRPNQNSAFGPPRLAHLSLTEYLTCNYISRIKFDSYFKFSFIRNPWDRAVSIYKYITKGNRPFCEFLRKELTNKNSPLFYFYRPQSDFIIDPHGRLKTNFIGKFETINRDILLIKNRLGLQGNLKHINASKLKSMPQLQEQKPYQAFYDSNTKRMIEEFYGQDIKSFGYKF